MLDKHLYIAWLRCRYPKWLSLLLAFGLSFLLGLFPLAFKSEAVPISSVPNPRLNNTWVADTVNLLSPDTEDELNQLFSTLEAKNGEEIVVVTVLDTQTFLQPGDFARKLNLTWQLGKKDLNNGVVILVSKAENTTSIDMGWGLGMRKLFSENQYDELIASIDKPLDQDNFETNLVTVAQVIINKLENPTVDSPVTYEKPPTVAPTNTVEQSPTTDTKDQDSSDWIMLIFIAIGMLILLVAFFLLVTIITPFLYLIGQAFIFVLRETYFVLKKLVFQKRY
ncbi:TPM domain-containing protein [Acaryochloris marina NIES-2412]|uniref:TPM domain-containing protein n=1 Tax=Acaryochloris marina TaxID=155978 RepID=UPI0040599DA1